MTNEITAEPIRVTNGGDVGGYFYAPATQIAAIEELFRSNGVSYWLDGRLYAFDGKPPVGVFNLSVNADPVRVQTLLDAVP